jgi:hypothetical protein
MIVMTSRLMIIFGLVVSVLRFISFVYDIEINNWALLDFIMVRFRRCDLWLRLLLRDLRLLRLFSLSLRFLLWLRLRLFYFMARFADIEINILMVILVDKPIIIKMWISFRVALSEAMVLAMSRVFHRVFSIAEVVTHSVGFTSFSVPKSMPQLVFLVLFVFVLTVLSKLFFSQPGMSQSILLEFFIGNSFLMLRNFVVQCAILFSKIVWSLIGAKVSFMVAGTSFLTML